MGIDLEEKIKKLETLGEDQEKKYSQTYGRKDHYKALYWGVENKMKEMKLKTELHELGSQLDSLRSLSDGYKRYVDSMVRDGPVAGRKLVQDKIDLEEKIKKTGDHGRRARK